MTIIRVSSLYGHCKLVVWSLGSCFILSLAGTMVENIRFIHMSSAMLYYEFLPGCYIVIPENDSDLQGHVWISALSLEGVLMLLMAYKVVSSYWNRMNRIIAILARDSVVYFVAVFVGLALASDLIPVSLLFFPLRLTQCIVSVAVGRMMMNIRGLILNDPEHTMHLRTLEFASCHDSDSEIEEARYWSG
ncbi:hypothetical protein PILCRDRAFT_173363 [Piloderma croceum F 1598]|uniref:Uncharacterized protein n=1 Tax=Piloderma croceum (strain F 1598) TaxID=765440 RepID=A0A0C3CKH0_PILCF|nr:hypothetical protein PILCRDRAFT_173363 [Piloderma croceum F 1598]